jgi:hypothetical protein
VTKASSAPGGGDEVLVVLDPRESAEALERLRERHHITQVGSPRVVVLGIAPGEPGSLESVPGVVAVSRGPPLPDAVVEELDDRETLFVTAWASRMTAPEKQRQGEGRPWDASGFEPPDPPVESAAPDEGREGRGHGR